MDWTNQNSCIQTVNTNKATALFCSLHYAVLHEEPRKAIHDLWYFSSIEIIFNKVACIAKMPVLIKTSSEKIDSID